MLSTTDLAKMRAIANGSLALSANTTRNTGTGVDQYGNPTETWTAVLTGVACDVGGPSTATMQLYPQAFIGSERHVEIRLPVGSDVKRNDRVTAAGRTYRIEMDITRDSYTLLGLFVGVQVNEGFN